MTPSATRRKAEQLQTETFSFRFNCERYRLLRAAQQEQRYDSECNGSASSIDKDLREKLAHGGNIDSAKVVGEAIAKKALKAGVKDVVFDRGGFLYHGRVAALADAAREAGLNF